MTAFRYMGAALLLSAFASTALADPCQAIPDGMARKTELRVPQEVVGPVLYVGDGDGLCVAGAPGREADPRTWVEIRLQDFYAPELSQPGGLEAKAALTKITKGKRVGCMGGHYSYDRLVARCTDLNGNSLGDLMRKAGVAEGGNGHD